VASSTGAHALPHGVLPRIARAEIASHADEGQEREAASLDQREHVEAIADAADVHQEHAARAAKVRARQQRDPLLLCGEGDGVDTWIGQRAIDQNAVTSIGHVGELGDVVAP
jgi:hypothetical protein